MVDLPLILLGAAADAAGGVDPKTEAERRRTEKESREREAETEARHAKALEEWKCVKNEWSVNALRKTTLMPGVEVQGRVAFAGPAEAPPADTLLLQWKRPDGSFADLGRYARPPLPKPKPKAPDVRQSAFTGPSAY